MRILNVRSGRVFLFYGLVAGLTAANGGCRFKEYPGPATDPSQRKPIQGLTSISVEPSTVDVTIDNGVPVVQQFQAFGNVNGTYSNISNLVQWHIDRPTIAQLDAATGTVTAGPDTGGVIAVTAQSGVIEGRATMTVHFKASFTADPPSGAAPVPQDPQSRFGGSADASRAPLLVYPNDQTSLPPNIPPIEVHFKKGQASDELFDIWFKNPVTDIHVYTRCATLNGGCLYQPSTATWRAVRETAAGSGPLQVRVRGTSDDGGGFGESGAITISFTHDPLKGVVYYWSTTDSAIMRWDFNATSPKAETFLSSTNVDGRCVGCHALRGDGKRLAASLDGQEGGDPVLFDVLDKTSLATITEKSQFESWAPYANDNRFVGVGRTGQYTGANELKLFDGDTGALLDTIDLNGSRADHPDWSPTGEKIVFTTVDTSVNVTDQRPFNTGLAYIEKNGSGWSPPKEIVGITERENNYYPAFAPDGQFIVYNRSSCTAEEFTNLPKPKACDCDTDPSAKVWARYVPGGAPVELKAANSPGIGDDGETRLTNTFPKWNPFTYEETEQNRTYWLTFSSTRAYGLRTPMASSNDESLMKRGTLLWMVAVSTSKMAGGIDPSAAAFCLPFQNIATSNHIAQWAEYVPIIP